MPYLDKRLKQILSEINCETLADVGCDHGKLSVAAVITGRAKKAYAIDISEKSLVKTALLAKEHNLSDKIIPLCGDGLKPLKDKVDLVVIAGMGGNEIIKILTESNYRGNAILVPHQDPYKLRDFLSNKFRIEKDYIVKAGRKFYPIIVLKEGCDTYTENEKFLGKNQPFTPTFYDFLQFRRGHILEMIGDTELPNDNILIRELLEINSLCLR